MAGGRPTKYSPEICSKVGEYLSKCRDTIDENGRLKVKLPTVEGLAKHLGVVSSTIHLWANEYPLFSESLKEIIDAQKELLVSNGLAGSYNPTIAKLMLSANHGMKEKSEVESTNTTTLKLEDLSNDQLQAIVKGTSS